MPVFKPSTSETRAGTSAAMLNIKDKLHAGIDRKDSFRIENLMSNMSLGMSLGMYCIYGNILLSCL